MKLLMREIVNLNLDSSKEASLGEQPLYTSFKYRLSHESIHTALQSLNLERIELVWGQAADKWLWVTCWRVLRKELPYFHCWLDTVADRHCVVHDDKLVIVSILFKASFDELEGLMTVTSQVRTHLVLLQRRHDWNHVVRVVIHNKNACVGVFLSITHIKQVH